MNAALGGVSEGGTGTPLFEVTHSGGGPSALVANQSVGNAGGVTPSKFSLNVTRPEHGGHGLPPESFATVGATATPAMSTAKQTKLLKVVCLELDWTLQSSCASIEAVCLKTLQDVNSEIRNNPRPRTYVKLNVMRNRRLPAQSYTCSWI